MRYSRIFNDAARRRDIYETVTNRVIADLEKGVRPWVKPWNSEHLEGRIMRPLRHNGERYSGINVLMLWSAAEEQGFASPTWMTYKQALTLGGQVRKGEHGSPVVYASTFAAEEETDDGDTVVKEVPFLKTYTVFNVEQIDGLPERYRESAPEPLNPVERIAEAEHFFAATGAEIRHVGTQALYSVTHDHIRMPPIDTFRDAESYYATLAHETTHWTRHPSRLDREFGRKRFGDEGYAREELVAELGAAYLCADLGLEPVVREDHAAYIKSWLKVLKEDKRAIFQAAAYAQRAADFLHEMQPEQAPAPAPERDPEEPASVKQSWHDVVEESVNAAENDEDHELDEAHEDVSDEHDEEPDGQPRRPRNPQMSLF